MIARTSAELTSALLGVAGSIIAADGTRVELREGVLPGR